MILVIWLHIKIKIKSESENNNLWNTDSYGAVESNVSVKNADSSCEYFKKLREEIVNYEQNNSDK